VLRFGLSKKLDPTLNTSPMNSVAYNNQDLTLMIANHIVNGFSRLKVGALPPCWDLLTPLSIPLAFSASLILKSISSHRSMSMSFLDNLNLKLASETLD
jgi:hypothetical protein